MADFATTNSKFFTIVTVDAQFNPVKVKQQFYLPPSGGLIGAVKPDNITITQTPDGTISAINTGGGTVTNVTSNVSGFSFGANPSTTPALTLQNVSSATTNYLRGDGTWQNAVSSVTLSGGTSRFGALTLTAGQGINIVDTNGNFTFSINANLPILFGATAPTDATGNDNQLYVQQSTPLVLWWKNPSVASNKWTAFGGNILAGIGNPNTTSVVAPSYPAIYIDTSVFKLWVRSVGATTWSAVADSGGAQYLYQLLDVYVEESGTATQVILPVTIIAVNNNDLEFSSGFNVAQYFSVGDKISSSSVGQTVTVTFVPPFGAISRSLSVAPDPRTIFSVGSAIYKITGGTVSDGYVLTWVQANNRWEAKAPTGGGGGLTSFTSPQGTISIGGSLTAPTVDIAQQSATNGQVLSWNGTKWAPLSLSGTGTVTSVAMTVPSPLSIAGSPITSSGTLALTWGTGQIPVANLGSGTATSSNFLRGDGTWATPSGGGSPAGSNTSIQYNNNGVFGGDSSLTWNVGATFATLGVNTSNLSLNNFISQSMTNTGGTVGLTQRGGNNNFQINTNNSRTFIASDTGIQLAYNQTSSVVRSYGIQIAQDGITLNSFTGSISNVVPLNVPQNTSGGTIGPGTAGQVLTSAGAGATPYWSTVSGGGSPGGTNTTIQFNNNGAFGGNSIFTYDNGGQVSLNTSSFNNINSSLAQTAQATRACQITQQVSTSTGSFFTNSTGTTLQSQTAISLVYQNTSTTRLIGLQVSSEGLRIGNIGLGTDPLPILLPQGSSGGTVGSGTVGQVITSGGANATPYWSTVSGGTATPYAYNGSLDYSSLRLISGTAVGFSGNPAQDNVGTVNVTFNASAVDGQRPNITLGTISGATFSGNQSFYIFAPDGTWNITYAYLNSAGTQLATNAGILNTERNNIVAMGTYNNCIITGVDVVNTEPRSIRFGTPTVGATQATIGLQIPGEANFATETIVAGSNTFWDTDATGNPRINASIPIQAGQGWILSIGTGQDITGGNYTMWTANTAFPVPLRDGTWVTRTGFNGASFGGGTYSFVTNAFRANSLLFFQRYQAWVATFTDTLVITAIVPEDDLGRISVQTSAPTTAPVQSDATIQGLWNLSNPNAGSDFFNSCNYDDASGTYEYQRATVGMQILVPTWQQVMTQGNAINATATGTPLILRDSQGTPNQITLSTPATISASYSLTLPNAQGANGQVLTNNGSGALYWATPSGGGGGGSVIPYVEFTSSATPSAGQTFTNTNIGQYNSDATQATVVVNGAVIRPTIDYTFSGNTMTMVQWLNASSVIQVQSKGSTAPISQAGNAFIARRTTAIAYTGGNNNYMDWSGSNSTVDVSSIANLAVTNGIFQNTASGTRCFSLQAQITFQGAAANINEALVWIQQGANLGDVNAASGLRYGLVAQRTLGTNSATLAITANVYVPANNYFATWFYCDQSANINGPSSATAVYGIQGNVQNRIVIREI